MTSPKGREEPVKRFRFSAANGRQHNVNCKMSFLLNSRMQCNAMLLLLLHFHAMQVVVVVVILEIF